MNFLFKAFLISFVIVSANAMGQSYGFKIKPLEYTKDSGNLHFPVFYRKPADTRTTEKINQYLQLSELELLNGLQTKTIFEKVKIDDGSLYGRKWDMTYSIYSNNEKVLSLGFDESSSGMTTHYWSRYYTFNAKNGDVIQLSDLFTLQGYRKFHKYLIKKSIREFRKQLLGIDTTITNNSDWDEIIPELGQSNITDFYIKGTSIILDGNNLLNKDQKIAMDITVKFKLPEFESYLNDYGKCIFGLKSGDIAEYRSCSSPQLFTGKIDKYPVLFIIRQIYANEYEGIYCYQKFGKGIYMTGKVANGKIKLEEKTDQLENRAFIKGKITQDSITGTWTKNVKGPSLQLLVYRK